MVERINGGNQQVGLGNHSSEIAKEPSRLQKNTTKTFIIFQAEGQQPIAASETAPQNAAEIQERYQSVLNHIEDLTQKIREQTGQLSKLGYKTDNLGDVKKLKKKARKIAAELQETEKALSKAKAEKTFKQSVLKEVDPQTYHQSRLTDLQEHLKGPALGKAILSRRSSLNDKEQIFFDKALIACSKGKNYEAFLAPETIKGLIQDEEGNTREKALDLVKSIVKEEIENSEPSTIFRTDSLGTKLFTKYIQLNGSSIAKQMLEDSQTKAQDFELELDKVAGETQNFNDLAKEALPDELLDSFKEYGQSLINGAADALKKSPDIVSLLKTVDDAYPDKKSLEGKPSFSITQLFLRLLNPALANLDLNPVGSRLMKDMTGKIIQKKANGTHFATRQPNLAIYDKFVDALSLDDLENAIKSP